MDIQKQKTVEEDAWHPLKQFTAARIALGRTGNAIPLKELLKFRLAHAHARDAVYARLHSQELVQQLQQFNLPVYSLHSKAKDRNEYLLHPDLGRQLNDASVQLLQNRSASFDIVLILADGLSATAVNHHAVPLLQLLIPLLQESNFSIAITTAQQARVAVGDTTGSLMHAKLSLVLIGERPGLSAADSMGAYLTYNPTVGLTDESRNCISNIRPEGMDYAKAAAKIHYLITASFRLQYSGVLLKDEELDILEEKKKE
ncbi:ethanolamine ammonia-lyase subunit EutC [Lacibacter sediminis]|uniref:Ethanolamine ammonia-lyase small subunit n=1 Tax=Lacibacter sediminis TaxID=2760713 RepID=A0A7G5XC55_9BACT|nr:ethanolamine ammonia-lyase subunit EutC [Lacibacter sediminis]QNA43058.1 ethanolamine ammonia-lyase subunit EutC [Lacibacter sediminis]